MLIVALSGGIASGKSVVAKVLEDLGCYIHRADVIAHELIAPEKPAWKKVVDHFGQKILNEDKTVNRARLAKIVFEDEGERRFLNQLLHPLVLEKKKKAIRALRREGPYKIFVSEAALTIEAGFADLFDKIIIVYCKKEIQAKRLMDRDNISRKEALKKINAQMKPEKKLKYADYIVDSSGSLESTIEQTEWVFRQLMLDYEMKYKTPP